jgi:hypothetical protein
MRHPLRQFALLLSVAAAACIGDRSGLNIDLAERNAAPRELTPRDEGDVRITSTDGAIVLAVLGDSVVMQLGDSIRQHVKSELASEADREGGLAGAIIGAVGSVVNTALGVTVAVPAEQVHDLRFEDGHLRFRVDGSVKMQVKSDDNGSEGGRFAPADADRFIEAVRAAQARREGRRTS